MRMHIYSFWDLDLEEFSPIWCAKNYAAAVRIVQATLGGAPGSAIVMHPERFELVDLGSFNCEDMREPIEPCYVPLGLVSSIIAAAPAQSGADAPAKEDK